MTVEELIRKLQKMNPESEVVMIDSSLGVVPVETVKSRKQFDLGAQHLKGDYTLLED